MGFCQLGFYRGAWLGLAVWFWVSLRVQESGTARLGKIGWQRFDCLNLGLNLNCPNYKDFAQSYQSNFIYLFLDCSLVRFASFSAVFLLINDIFATRLSPCPQKITGFGSFV